MRALARRLTEIQPFHAMALLARAREMEAQGRDIVHMELGEPDFATPEPIVAAGIEALQRGFTHYTPATGLLALREAIAAYYLEHFEVVIDPRRVVVTPGSSGALQLVMLMLINPGERVLLTDPGYPCNRQFVRLADGHPAALNVDAARGFKPSPEQVDGQWTDTTRALMLASPSNPTGAVLSISELDELAQIVAQREGALIVDEIYQGLVFDQPDCTALALDVPDLFVINSFSKYFGMTGWRLGWMVIPERFIDAADRLAQNLFLAAPTVAQHAALVALAPQTQSILRARRDVLRERRDYLIPALEGLGYRLSGPPAGAFYVYADASELAADSFQWSERLLTEAGVAVTPGIDFGAYQASRYLRFAFTSDLTRLQQGVQRLSALQA